VLQLNLSSLLTRGKDCNGTKQSHYFVDFMVCELWGTDPLQGGGHQLVKVCKQLEVTQNSH
jgi:hypothetical protein